MKTSASFLSSFVLPLAACALFACGGAVEGRSSSSSSGGGGNPGEPDTTTNPVPPSPGSSQPPTVVSPPAVDNGTWSQSASGCGNFFVYATHASKTKFLTVSAVKSELGIANLGDSATIQIGVNPTKTTVSVDTYPHVPNESPYCTDYITDPMSPERAYATQGTLTFTISTVGSDGQSYAVDVAITGLVVQHMDGTLEAIPDVTYHDVSVGWLAG
jgi:hypothetical protein